jgi:hypothetical protein
MTIEFRCPSCNQQLRVPDESVGKKARCPKCQAIVPVPAGGSFAGPATPLGSPAPGAPFVPPSVPTAAPPATPPASPFGQPGAPQAPPGAPSPFGPPSAANPFAIPPGAQGGFQAPPPKPNNPFAAEGPINPYASQAVLEQPSQIHPGQVGNQVVGLDPILNYATEIWKANLGLLVGVAATVLAITYGMAFVIGFAQAGLEANKAEPAMTGLIVAVGNLFSNVIQIFLGIGQAQIALKLARRQPAQYSDLFNGGSRFFPVLGAVILGGIAIGVGFLLCVIPGIALLLIYWPFYYLVVDGRCSVMESFELAGRITQGNRLTTFLVWLLSVGIGILGVLALCVGVIFALPLVSVLWAVAYLMMSGQLPQQPGAKPFASSAGSGSGMILP